MNVTNAGKSDPDKRLNAPIQALRESLDRWRKLPPSRETVSIADRFQFDRIVLGPLVLTREDAVKYLELRKKFYESVDQSLVSRSTVNRLVKQAITKTLTAEDGKDFQIKLKSNLSELRKQLSGPPGEWEIHQPVMGIVTEGLPLTIGRVTFYHNNGVTPESLHNAIEEAEAAQYTDEEVRPRDVEWWSDTIEAMLGVVARVRVRTHDQEAAAAMAIKQIQTTLDVLNFFGDIPGFVGGSAMAHFPWQARQGDFRLMYFRIQPARDHFGSIGPKAKTNHGSFRLPGFQSEGVGKLGFARIEALLAKDLVSGGFEDKLVASYQWAGRATFELNPEESFLLYAIALESLLLKKSQSDLTYKLSTRAAILLGNTLEARQYIKKRVNKLYEIRSNIVHSGSFEMKEEDLSEIRMLTKCALIEITTHPDFQHMTTVDELEEWFEERMLSGRPLQNAQATEETDAPRSYSYPLPRPPGMPDDDPLVIQGVYK